MAFLRHRLRSDAPTVILHWMLVTSLVFSLLTGLRIAADDPESSWAKAVSAITLQGDVVRWHIAAAYALTLVSIGYVVFLIRARLLRRINPDTVRKALQSPDRKMRWRAINITIYWLAFILIGIATATGIALYVLPGLLPYEGVLLVHRLVAWSIVAYTLIHVAAQAAQGGVAQLLKLLTPKPVHVMAGVAALAVTSVAGAAIFLIDENAIQELKVMPVETAPVIDGHDDDWGNIEPVTIPTQRGANMPGGETAVSVRMVHKGEHIYALFQWPDATRSQKHLPLKKIGRGWIVMQTEFGIQDEDEYYEDKFGVMFARTPEFAGAGTTHLGPKPLKGKPGPAGGRGLHYTTDGSIVDVWHWKSVRTGASGQIDDNYFGPPMEPDPRKKRYTGGYTQDPGEGGGYTMNWETFGPDVIAPKRLPKDPSALRRLGDVNLDPRIGDDGEFWMAMDETIPYSEEADIYPVGTVMPSVLVKGQRKGDRGDVRALARWQDGVWTLEAMRKRDTGSDFDVTFAVNAPIYLWVAVFDHSQTRHSQHLRPVRVVLE